MALEKIPKTSLEDVVEQKSVVSEVLLPDARDNELSFQGIDGAESRAQLSREESKHDSNGQSLEQSIVDERHQFKVVLDTSMAVSPATTVTVDNSLHLDASEHNHENALKFSTDDVWGEKSDLTKKIEPALWEKLLEKDVKEAINQETGEQRGNAGTSPVNPFIHEYRISKEVEPQTIEGRNVQTSEQLNNGSTDSVGTCENCTSRGCRVNHRVTWRDNRLQAGQQFSNTSFKSYINPDLYAVEKELYLGSLCEVPQGSKPWQFWMIMLKNGNFDTDTGLCPSNGKRTGPFKEPGRFPCFGKGCMNHPLLYHNPSRIQSGGKLEGSFYGSYDLDADLKSEIENISYYSVAWEKNPETGSWVFHHTLKTSQKYPWLMLYLRADATRGYSGGYHYETRGMMKKLPESPNFKVHLTLNITKGGGPRSQFYLTDIGSCWKNDGRPCDGDVESDVTRYSEMIINPDVTNGCKPGNLFLCPPYHITATGTKIYRNDTNQFPYAAYHYYCSPGNAKHLENTFGTCDPYSNPQAQELMQLLPHPEWAVHGYPSMSGEGWVGDPRTWELDLGALSSRLYFYQDPGTKPARRIWSSIDVGTEIFVSDKDETAEWTVSDFDVVVPVADKR